MLLTGAKHRTFITRDGHLDLGNLSSEHGHPSAQTHGPTAQHGIYHTTHYTSNCSSSCGSRCGSIAWVTYIFQRDSYTTRRLASVPVPAQAPAPATACVHVYTYRDCITPTQTWPLYLTSLPCERVPEFIAANIITQTKPLVYFR